MELVRLSAPSIGTPTYQPDVLIEDYTSLIWTERYAEAGTLELHTYDIAATRAILPIDSLVSLRDSNEVVLIEDHLIKEDEDGNKELTITGRTIDSFLEQRIFQGPAGVTQQSPRNYTCAQAAAGILWNYFNNNSANHYDLFAKNTDGTSAQLTGDENLLNLSITDSSTTTDAAQAWFFDPGYVYPKFLDILAEGGLGVRNVRPSGFAAPVVSITVTSAYSSSGAYAKTAKTNLTTLTMDIYNGKNRSLSQSVNKQVVFYSSLEGISGAQYLFTKKNFKNHGNYAIKDQFQTGYYPAPNDILSGGFYMRSLFVDLGNTDISTTSSYAAASQATKAAVRKTQKQIFFDGEITPQAPYKYNVDYGLGDTITLVGEYGIQQDMQVTEFVRTQDSDGERGYPTLTSNGA